MTALLNNLRLRLSITKDLGALVRLEEVAFTSDRFTAEHIEYLLSRARSTIFIAEINGEVAGAAYLLWRKKAQSGRLYNFAVDPRYQAMGIGSLLLQESEREAARRGYLKMNLEVRLDNESVIRYYELRGYQAFKQTPDFYDDGSPALRMSKAITINLPTQIRYKVPYYSQTLGFTCGPACLIMAMKYFQPHKKINRTLEMNLWKEATLIFMTSGIGGTDPFGIALAAVYRHFPVRVLASTEKTPFVRSVRIPEKRTIIRLVHGDMKNRALAKGVGFSAYDFGFDDIKSALLQGWIPIALISTYRLLGTREPHWVVITGFDENYVYVNDPYLARDNGNIPMARNIRIEHKEFHRMSRYGKDVYRCTVFIGKPEMNPASNN